VSLHDRDESVVECQPPTASRRRQVRPAVPRTACVVKGSASGVQTTSTAVAFVAAVADQTDSDLA